jgi:hypothetical protein
MGKLLQTVKSPEERAAIVNEYFDLEQLYKAFQPTSKRREQVRQEIVSWCEDPAKEYSEKTDRVHLIISPCADKREIDTRAAYKVLGLKQFLLAAKVSMTALADYLTKPVIEAMAVTTQTGPRTLNPTPIVAAPVEAAKLAA